MVVLWVGGLCKTPSTVIPYSDTGSPNRFSAFKRRSESCTYANRKFCKALGSYDIPKNKKLLNFSREDDQSALMLVRDRETFDFEIYKLIFN